LSIVTGSVADSTGDPHFEIEIIYIYIGTVLIVDRHHIVLLDDTLWKSCPVSTKYEAQIPQICSVVGHEITTLNACRIGGILSIEVIFSLK